MFSNKLSHLINKNIRYLSNYNVNIFIRNAITQLKTLEEIEKTSKVIDYLKSVKKVNNCDPIFLTNMINSTEQEKNIKNEYTPEEFRNNRLDLVSKADLFVFVYDEKALSVSGGVELGYWLNLNKERKHTVVILMNYMTTTLVKMLPDTTYIQIDNSFELDENHFPNLIKLKDPSELTQTFEKILNKQIL